MKNVRLAAALSMVAAATLAGCAAYSAGPTATAKLDPTRGNATAGTVTFAQSGDVVKVSGSITGLKPNAEHGFHIHEKGDCSSGDGMSIDSQGNLWVAAGLHNTRGTSETLDTKCGVHVISPQGKLIDFIPIPEDTITNTAFGGPDMKTLYVTAGDKVFKRATKLTGIKAWEKPVNPPKPGL